MKDFNTIRSNSNSVAFPGNAAVNASTPTSFDGTELDADEMDQGVGFLQALLVETGATPDGNSEAGTGTPPVNSQGVQSLRDMVQNGAVNAHFNGTNWIYLTAGKAARWVVDEVNEVIKFQTAISGAAGGVITWVDTNGIGGFLHVQDQKTSGTQSGTFTSGAWQTRTLNTVLTNTITGASLSTNQITLPAGEYFINGSAPALDCSIHKSKLYNVTDVADEVIGTSEYCDATGNVQNRSFVIGRFTIASSKVFELQHRCTLTRATDGFGTASSLSVVEIYADVKIWKIG